MRFSCDYNTIAELNHEIEHEIGWSLIPKEVAKKLEELGIYTFNPEDQEVRRENVGDSDYSKHFIQPWAIWQDYNLDPWEADIVKRVLRKKASEPRARDFTKIIHICKEKLRQIRCHKMQ